MNNNAEVRKSVRSLPIKERTDVRVAAYCRVSNDKLEDSLEVQKKYFEKKIKSTKNWKYVGIYHDDGISGTTVEQRPAFKRLLADCDAGKIDLILTKEASRFSRNLADSIKIYEDLLSKHVYVMFEADGLCTQEPRDLEYLRRISEQAEYEVRRTSARVIFSQQFKVENGLEFGHKMLGYKPVNGKMEIVDNPTEIEIIKKIFHDYADGKGSDTIAKEIREKYPDFVPEYAKDTALKHSWTSAKIRRILKNEKYVGDCLFRKFYVQDPMTHKIISNDLNKPNDKRANHDQIYLKDNHEAIIDRETWDRVQARFKEYNDNLDDGRRERHSNSYWCSGNVYCGVCGGHFVSTKKKISTGYHQRWRCYNNSRYGKSACSSLSVSMNVLNAAMGTTINLIFPDRKKIKAEIEEELKKIKGPDRAKAEEQVKKLKSKLDKENKNIEILTQESARLNAQLNAETDDFEREFLNKKISSLDKQSREVFNEIQRLEKEIDNVKVGSNEKERIAAQNDFKRMLNKFCKVDLNGDNSALYKELCEKIVINTEEKTIEVFIKHFPNSFKYRFDTFGAQEKYTVNLELFKMQERQV